MKMIVSGAETARSVAAPVHCEARNAAEVLGSSGATGEGQGLFPSFAASDPARPQTRKA